MAEENKVIGWFTRNGHHVPIFENNPQTQAEQKKEREIKNAQDQADALNNPLKAHFEKENKRVEEFIDKKIPKGKGAVSIEMENGQILEHYTMKTMMSYLKEAKDAGEMWDDDQISIRYKDGKIESYIEGDDTSKMKLTNIDGIIYNNSATYAYAGNGTEIVNHKELFPKDYPDNKGYEDDWRIQFYTYSPWK